MTANGSQNDLFGFYRGIVKKHLANGMCKVFIPGVYPREYENHPDSLPDAEQASPLFGGGTGGNGAVSYPDVEATVWCFFQNGDQNLPVYFAQTLLCDEGTSPFSKVRTNASDDGDPSSNTSLTGHDAQNHMIRCGKSLIYIAESGQIEITTNADQDVDPGADEASLAALAAKSAKITIDGNGYVTIQGTQDISLKAPTINLDAEDEVNVNTSQFVLNANVIETRSTFTTMVQETAFALSADAVQLEAPEHVKVKSPAINMDAREGYFYAKGANWAPVQAL